jgi:hypothetical protein
MGYRREDAELAIIYARGVVSIAAEMLLLEDVSEAGLVKVLVATQRESYPQESLDLLIASGLRNPEALQRLKAGQHTLMVLTVAGQRVQFALTPEIADEFLVRTTRRGLADTAAYNAIPGYDAGDIPGYGAGAIPGYGGGAVPGYGGAMPGYGGGAGPGYGVPGGGGLPGYGGGAVPGYGVPGSGGLPGYGAGAVPGYGVPGGGGGLPGYGGAVPGYGVPGGGGLPGYGAGAVPGYGVPGGGAGYGVPGFGMPGGGPGYGAAGYGAGAVPGYAAGGVPGYGAGGAVPGYGAAAGGEVDPDVLAIGNVFRQFTEAEQVDVLTLAEEIRDPMLAVQYYLLADKNLEQARALAGNL